MDLFTDCYIEMWKGNLVIKKYGRSPKILHGDKFHNTAEVINIDRQKNTANYTIISFSLPHHLRYRQYHHHQHQQYRNKR